MPGATVSNAKPAVIACLSPLVASFENPKLEPTTLDDAKLAEVERSSASAPEKAFARGRVYFEARHWVESGAAFRDVAFRYPDDDVGIYASQLYLESINIIGAQGPRPACYEDMARDVPQLATLYCTTRRKTHEEQCRIFDKIQIDILRLAAERAVEAGDKSSDVASYRDGAEKYFEVLRAYCLDKKGAERCDELAYNAAMAYLAAGDERAAESVRVLMVDPRNGMDKSPLLKRLTCKLDPACH